VREDTVPESGGSVSMPRGGAATAMPRSTRWRTRSFR